MTRSNEAVQESLFAQIQKISFYHSENNIRALFRSDHEQGATFSYDPKRPEQTYVEL